VVRVERFVYNPKYVKLLVGLTGKTAQIDELAKKNNINAGHLRIVIDQWTRECVVSKDKHGREYNVSLTEKGEEISLKLAELVDSVKNYVPKVKEGPIGIPVVENTLAKKETKTEKKVEKGANNESK